MSSGQESTCDCYGCVKWRGGTFDEVGLDRNKSSANCYAPSHLTPCFGNSCSWCKNKNIYKVKDNA
jgi:hypothetical protein